MLWLEKKMHTPSAYDDAVVTVGDRIYCFGGKEDGAFIHVFYLETRTSEIVKLAYNNSTYTRFIPLDRVSFTLAAYNKKVYLWGGLLRTHNFSDDKLYCFDTETSLWSIPETTGFVPLACTGHTACVIRNKMYTFGGVVNITGRYTNTLHCLNLDTMEWSIVYAQGAHVYPTAFHSALAVADKMYVTGGINLQLRGELATYCFDTVTNTWTWILPDMEPAHRRLHCTWAYRDYIFMFHGSDGNNTNNGVVSSELLRYSLKDKVWDQMEVYGRVPKLNGGQHCAVVDDKVYVFCCQCSKPYHVASENDDGDDSSARNNDLPCKSYIYVLSYAPLLKTISIVQALNYGLHPTDMPKKTQDLVQLLT